MGKQLAATQIIVIHENSLPLLVDHRMAQTKFVKPNHYELSGNHIHVSYSTSGIDGKGPKHNINAEAIIGNCTNR